MTQQLIDKDHWSERYLNFVLNYVIAWPLTLADKTRYKSAKVLFRLLMFFNIPGIFIGLFIGFPVVIGQMLFEDL